MALSAFDQLALASAENHTLALAYNEVIRRLLAMPLWTCGSAYERRVLWTDADMARSTDLGTFKLPGLYIWGAEGRPVYIGKTGSKKTKSNFRKRFYRYIWHKWSQCNLAREFETALVEKGIGGFSPEIRNWYAKDFRRSTVRLEGAVRFATEGINTVWFALFPANDLERIRPLEKALIPVANAWNLQAGMKPLLNIESNRRLW